VATPGQIARAAAARQEQQDPRGVPAEGLGPADPLRRAVTLRGSLVKRRSVIAARLDRYLELLGPDWHAAFGGDLLLLTVLRFLAAGYADPHAVRRLGRARLTRLIWRWSHGAWGEDHASRILAAAAGSLQLWDTELSYLDWPRTSPPSPAWPWRSAPRSVTWTPRSPRCSASAWVHLACFPLPAQRRLLCFPPANLDGGYPAVILPAKLAPAAAAILPVGTVITEKRRGTPGAA
jgi:hypothetical protein